MTGEDDLRARLSAIDPQRPDRVADGASVPSTTSSALTAEMKERVMETMDKADAMPESPTRQGRPGPLAVAAAAVLVAVIGIGGWWASSHDDPAVRPAPAAPLALSVGPGDAMTSCIRFDVAILADMPVAFAATATTVGGNSLTLHVDRWYTGGSAETVTVDVPSGQTSAALDGVDFVQGERYLLTATNGTVNGCGYSGSATPQLEKAFAEAFPG